MNCRFPECLFARLTRTIQAGTHTFIKPLPGEDARLETPIYACTTWTRLRRTCLAKIEISRGCLCQGTTSQAIQRKQLLFLRCSFASEFRSHVDCFEGHESASDYLGFPVVHALFCSSYVQCSLVE